MEQEQAIRELAYSKWEEAGYPAGDGVNFWLEAETELKADGEGGQKTINLNTQGRKPETAQTAAAAKKSVR